MIIRSAIVCAAIAASVNCEEISVNRHFRGDIFSKDGKFNFNQFDLLHKIQALTHIVYVSARSIQFQG